jgi:hypothetical protein
MLFELREGADFRTGRWGDLERFDVIGVFTGLLLAF